jgi:hypothetical protein
MTTIVVASSDLHVGSSLGLCTRYFERSSGDSWRANKGQRWTYSKWQTFWDKVRETKSRLLEDFPEEPVSVWHVVVGDAPDKDSRGVERVTNNPSEILTLLSKLLDETNDVVDLEFMVRGTTAHSGQQGWMEEEVGKDRGAVQNPETGAFSWYHLPIETDGLRINFYHRPPTVGTKPHTEDHAPLRANFELRSRFTEAGEPIPDFVFFGHYHYFTTSRPGKKPFVVYLPSWQLPYDWIHNIGRGMFPRPVGGTILVCRNGRGEFVDFSETIFKPRRTRRWTIKDLSTN